MVTFLTENGVMTKLMATVYTLMLMEQNMKVIGRMICNMAMVSKLGQMVHAMKVTIKMEKSMAKALMCGVMALNM